MIMCAFCLCMWAKKKLGAMVKVYICIGCILLSTCNVMWCSSLLTPRGRKWNAAKDDLPAVVYDSLRYMSANYSWLYFAFFFSCVMLSANFVDILYIINQYSWRWYWYYIYFRGLVRKIVYVWISGA
jgi:hypothetical protein